MMGAMPHQNHRFILLPFFGGIFDNGLHYALHVFLGGRQGITQDDTPETGTEKAN